MKTMAKEEKTGEWPVFFYHPPECRCSGIYLIGGYVLIVGTAAGVEQFVLGRGWNWICVLALIAAVPMLGGARYFLRKCLRVDERGVWQRRFFYWDLWS